MDKRTGSSSAWTSTVGKSRHCRRCGILDRYLSDRLSAQQVTEHWRAMNVTNNSRQFGFHWWIPPCRRPVVTAIQTSNRHSGAAADCARMRPSNDGRLDRWAKPVALLSRSAVLRRCRSSRLWNSVRNDRHAREDADGRRRRQRQISLAFGPLSLSRPHRRRRGKHGQSSSSAHCKAKE